ncbi:MAG TPA: hypothetical protein VK540_16050 [Polyangiaceae bacterium]|nr:hypothetical protein [Polyangiaceae bacterium]
MGIVELITAAIVSLAPNLPTETVDRYAADISEAADGELELAVALVSTQDAESSWRADVETCKITGDGGRAISAMQIHRHWWAGYSRAEICASNTLAVSLAASALTVLSHRTGGTRGALRAFVGCRPGDPRSVKRLRTYDRLLANARRDLAAN